MQVTSKAGSILILILAEAAGMIPWFTTAAVLPDMAREGAIAASRQALLSSGVQAGFVVGALFIAATQIADRFDPRRVICLCALAAAATNAMLIVAPLGGWLAITLRIVTGALLAGVYPIGMKIAVGWGTRDRGLLVGLLVGALTMGKSAPYLLAFLGGTDWRLAVAGSSLIAAGGGIAILFASLGPLHARAATFDPRAIAVAWTDRRVRSAYAGYFGHMWELFAFWAWVGTAASVSYAHTMETADAEALGKLTAFLAIGLGAPVCILAGWAADRHGKAEITILAMAASGLAAIATALSFGGPAWITLALMIVWGIAVIPDSAQFSALVADFAPARIAGSLLTLQTALGFTLTIVTVQVTPLLAGLVGWPAVLAGLALGPAVGILAMLPLRRRAATGN